MKERNGFVYFITDETAIKIGYSGAPALRLVDLQGAHPQTLRSLGTMKGSIDDERSLHKRFAHLRVRGEWFKSEPELLDFIEVACAPDPVEAEVTQVRRALAEWSKNKSSQVKMFCESLNILLRNMIENPHYPNLYGSAAMTIESIEGALAYERRRATL